MSIKIVVLFVVNCALVFGISANDSICKSNIDCHEYAFCNHGSCKCFSEYVKYREECLPIKSYGEECKKDVQCNNERMICTNDDNDVHQKMFCSCDQFHLWNSTIEECLEVSLITRAGNFREVHNVSGMIERSAQKVFLGVVIAGLIFVSILLSFIGICSVYGCCSKHKKGKYGGSDSGNDQINEVAVVGLPGSYEAIETDFSAMAF